MLRTEPYSLPAISPTARLEVSCARIQRPDQTPEPAVHDSRLPLRLLLIVLKTLNVAPANEPLAVISIPDCSCILCEELIQIIRYFKDRGFQRGHRACFLDHDIMLLSLSVVQTWLAFSYLNPLLCERLDRRWPVEPLSSRIPEVSWPRVICHSVSMQLRNAILAANSS